MTLIWVENMVNNNIELEENKLGSTILKTKGVIVRDGGPIYITYIPPITTATRKSPCIIVGKIKSASMVQQRCFI